MNEIRSYVIRPVRMSDHQKESYNRLYHRYCISLGAATGAPDAGGPGSPPGLGDISRLDWNQVFPHRASGPESDQESDPDSGRPIVIDIGFGMGQELAELARNWPDKDFLGIEVHRPGVGRLLGELERLSLENVRVIQYDAVPVLRHAVPPGSVSAVHVFFPDPWPKKRHHKRRLVRPGFPELVAPVLQPGGYLYLVTDWEDYARQIRAVLDDSPLFRNRYHDAPEGFAPPREWRPRTAFERKGLQKGHAIFELLYDCQ